METLKDLQLEHLMVPVVYTVPALVVPTMAAVAVDMLVDPGAPALPVPIIVTVVAVSEPAARSLWCPLVGSYWNNTWSSGRTLT